jgi:NADPH:quinone reductase-like Zn-dependent oxidoreductase
MRLFAAVFLLTNVIFGSARAAPDKMHAVEIGPGVSLSVQTRPVPQPGPGEVLIRVRAAGVNPVDWKAAPRRVGLVPGVDVSGTIDTLGEGVVRFKVGEAVLGFARDSGSYAEYAVVPVTSLALKPKSMSFEEAAGVPVAAETAYRSLYEAARLQRGQTVLIHGAAGGVGSAAVQIAHAAGARVIGTASPDHHDYLRSIGADEVIDYRTQRFEDMAKDVDIVLNTVDAMTNARSIGVLKRGGTLVSIVGPPNPLACAAAGIRCTRPDRDTGAPNADLLERVVQLADDGKFRVNVQQVYPMEQTLDAWISSRKGHTRGKLVIRVSEGPTMKHQ